MAKIRCFPSGRLLNEMDGRNPESPGPLGKVVPAVPGSSRNCQIRGVSLVLAFPGGQPKQRRRQPLKKRGLIQ